MWHFDGLPHSASHDRARAKQNQSQQRWALAINHLLTTKALTEQSRAKPNCGNAKWELNSHSEPKKGTITHYIQIPPWLVTTKALLSWNHLLTNFEHVICSDSVFDLFASEMFGIVSKTSNS
jgi:hypothetical protein